LVLVGMPGSGKTTAAQRLGERLGAPVWSSGDIIRQIVAERALPPTAAADIARELDSTPGKVGRTMADLVARSPASVVVVEGFRTEADLAAFRARFPRATVVALEVGEARRHERMLKRGRAGESTRATLRQRDRDEQNRGVRAVMKQADVTLRPASDELAVLDWSCPR
jgi:dephospho-CoA kinase